MIKKNINYYFNTPNNKKTAMLLSFGGLLSLSGVIWAVIVNNASKYYLIPLLLGILLFIIGIVLIILVIIKTPSDLYIDKLIKNRIDKYLENKPYSPYQFGHYIITEDERKEEHVENVADFYTLRGRDKLVRSSMYAVNIYYIFDRRILVHELIFSILNEYQKSNDDAFFFQDIVKLNYTEERSENGDKQIRMQINLPMGENFTDVISNNEENIKKAQELVLLVNSKIDEHKLNTTNLNQLTKTFNEIITNTNAEKISNKEEEKVSTNEPQLIENKKEEE